MAPALTTSSTIFRDWLRSVVPEIETALELSISKGESDSLSEQLGRRWPMHS